MKKDRKPTVGQIAELAGLGVIVTVKIDNIVHEYTEIEISPEHWVWNRVPNKIWGWDDGRVVMDVVL